MATNTIPAPTLAAIEEVVHTYGVSNVQTQQAIQHRLSNGMGLAFFSLSLSGGGNRTLYERDFYDWTQTTAGLIRAGRVGDIDRETLAEEVESLGISQKHALGSHLKNLVMHLLKWHYQPSMRQTGHRWRSSIINARDEIAVILGDSPAYGVRCRSCSSAGILRRACWPMTKPASPSPLFQRSAPGRPSRCSIPTFGQRRTPVPEASTATSKVTLNSNGTRDCNSLTPSHNIPEPEGMSCQSLS